MNANHSTPPRVILSLIAFVALALTAGALHADPVLWIDDEFGQLGRVDVATGSVTIVGSMGVVMTDIAFAPNGDLYGITFTDLYRINSTTAGAALIGSTGVNGLNALVFGADGTLYAADNASVNLYSINASTGAATSLGGIGAFSAGDLAFVAGELYMSTTANQLIKIALTPTVSAMPVGPLGIANVFGLATPDNSALYAVSGTQIFSVNTATGAATQLVNYAGAGLSAAYGSSFITEAVPEPATSALAVLGFLAQCGVARRLNSIVSNKRASGTTFEADIKS